MQYISLTAAYLTVVCQVIIKVFYLHPKHVGTTTKMFMLDFSLDLEIVTQSLLMTVFSSEFKQPEQSIGVGVNQ